jgi:hypothetical protein
MKANGDESKQNKMLFAFSPPQNQMYSRVPNPSNKK